MVSLPSPAEAHLTGSTFQANDGNLVLESTPTGNTDWVNAPNFRVGPDQLDSTGADTSFAGGVSEDTPPDQVGVRGGSIPKNKADLDRFYLGYEKSSTSQHELLYLAWIRKTISGSVDMDFELNKANTTTANGLPTRSPGDLLITYEFIATKTPTIAVQTWNTDGTLACVTASSHPCWADRRVLDNTTSEAMVNDGFSTNDPTRWGPVGTNPVVSKTKDQTLSSQTFGEAAIDLSALGIFQTGSCTHFAQSFVKSRSSSSFNSTMKDYIPPINIDLSNCLTKSFDISAATGGAAPGTVPAGSTLYGVFTLNSVVHYVPLSAGTGTQAGHLVGSDSTVPPNSTLTNVHLELQKTGTPSVVYWSSNADPQESLTDASKVNTGTFGYTLTLQGVTNPENTLPTTGSSSHTFSAVMQAFGSINSTTTPAKAVVGYPVGWKLDSTSPTGCASISLVNGGITDSTGVSQATVTSSRACVAQVRAFVDRSGSTAGYDTGDPTATGSKTWAAYAISVTPGNASNPVGADHTFTVTVTKDIGAGPQPLAGQVVNLAIQDPGNIGAYIKSISPTTGSTLAADGLSGSCTTATNGTCSAVANTRTQVAGSFSLKASTAINNASGSVTIDSTGNKTYLDYQVDVSPSDVTNKVGDPETFTVTVTKKVSETAGYVAAGGVPVTLSLAPGTTQATITVVTPTGSTIAANGLSGTCTTAANGTCSVTISGPQPGTAVLTASIDIALQSDGVANGEHIQRSDTGTKHYVNYTLTVTHQGSSLNLVGQPHTFLVTLTKFDGTSAQGTGVGGETITLSLNPGTTGATITSITDANNPEPSTTSCVTRADGTCLVTINGTSAGSAVLTASWSKQLSDTSSISLSDHATKRYVDILVSKSGCVTSVPQGGLMTFDIPWSTAGTDLANAKIVDNLPSGMLYMSSSPTASDHPASGSTGPVTWNLGNLSAPASGTVHITVQVNSDSTNTGSFQAADPTDPTQTVSKSFSSSVVTVSSAPAGASGSAYAVKADALGTNLIPKTPYVSPAADGDLSLVSLHTASLPLLGMLSPVLIVDLGLLNASNHHLVTATQAEDRARASVADLTLTVAGMPITAKVVAAESDSTATGSNAGTSTQGSEVVDLSINGGAPVDYTSPTTLPVINLAGAVQVTVKVLETTDASGAAAGTAQPQSGLFSSGLTVNGLHVTATLAGTVIADVIVSSATSQAAFPTLNPCAGSGPYLIGNAYNASVQLTSPLMVGVNQGLVVLPAGGANPPVSRTINTLDLSPLVFSGTGTTSTGGSLSTLTVDSDAQTQGAEVTLGGMSLVSAALVHAHASVNSATPSNAEIAKKLVVAGINICSALAALPLPPPVGPNICLPAPNTVLLDATGLIKIVLNEQTTSSGVISVNAIHIYVLGAGNPLGLPVGLEVIVSHAAAGVGH